MEEILALELLQAVVLEEIWALKLLTEVAALMKEAAELIQVVVAAVAFGKAVSY